MVSGAAASSALSPAVMNLLLARFNSATLLDVLACSRGGQQAGFFFFDEKGALEVHFELLRNWIVEGAVCLCKCFCVR